MDGRIDRLMSDAWAARSAAQYERAEELLQQVLRIDPRYVQAKIALGMVAGEAGDTRLGLQRMGDVLRADPNCPPAITWTAIFLIRERRGAEALKFAEKAVALSSGHPDTLRLLAQALYLEGRYDESLGVVNQVLASAPGDVPSLLAAAGVLEKLSREGEAIQMYEKAIAISPEQDALERVAKLYLRYNRTNEALAMAQRAVEMDGSRFTSRSILARALLNSGRPDEAEEHWKASESLGAPPGEIRYRRALALQENGQFDEAIANLHASLEENPERAEVYQALFSAKRLGEEDRLEVERAESLLGTNGLGEADRGELHYALGKAFDDLGEYEKAIPNFDQANVISRKLRMADLPFDQGRFKALIDDRIAGFTSESLANARRRGIESDMPILVIGMMRSGTTLTEQILTCHHEVGGAGEQSFWADRDAVLFDACQLQINAPALTDAAQRYCDLLASIAPGSRRVTDKNPANFLVAGVVHAALPNARIIHTRRHPVDTALSIWMTPMRTAAPFAHDREAIVYAYRQYERLMEHWRSVLPPDRLLEIDYEDLVQDREAATRKVIEFCGLEWDEACLHPENNLRAVRTPSFWQVRQPVYKSSVAKWRNYEPWLGPFLELMEPAAQ